MPDQHDERVADLQALVRARLAELDRLLPGREGYDEAAAAVMDASAELIAYEDRLPRLRDEPPRALSLLVVRWGGRLVIAVAVLLGVLVLPGWVALWWLPALAMLLAVGLRLQFVPVEPPGGRHLEQRYGGWIAVAGSLLLLWTPTGIAGGWTGAVLALLGAVLVVAGTALAVRPPVTGPHPLTGRTGGPGGRR